MLHEIIMAGFGGQGIMSMGQLLTYAGMLEGKKVAWIPSYGPEMRGGTANCTVIVSPWEISSPVIHEPNSLIVMNRPSLEKFAPKVTGGGLLLFNSSLIQVRPTRKDIRVFAIPTNELAEQLKNQRVANMVMLGAFLEQTKAVSMEAVMASLEKVIPVSRHHLLELNRNALKLGANFQQQQLHYKGAC
jgi:2-oxoglutarate ferredoxin oxidoreductase subunit gamma